MAEEIQVEHALIAGWRRGVGAPLWWGSDTPYPPRKLLRLQPLKLLPRDSQGKPLSSGLIGRFHLWCLSGIGFLPLPLGGQSRLNNSFPAASGGAGL